METVPATASTVVKREAHADAVSIAVAPPRPVPPAAGAAPAAEPLQCSRCSKWLQPGAKYRNKRLRLCSSCYVNHYNHASQDAKKKYDRSRKRAVSERKSAERARALNQGQDTTEVDSPTDARKLPTPRSYAPIAAAGHPSAALPPPFSLPVVPQPVTVRAQPGFRPPLSPGHSMLPAGDVNQLGNPRSPSLLASFGTEAPILRGRIGSGPSTPTGIPLLEVNQLSGGRMGIGSPAAPGTPTMPSLFTLPVNPLTVSLSPLLPSAALSEPPGAKDVDLQVGTIANRVMNFDQQTDTVINAVASLIRDDDVLDESRVQQQYQEVDLRRMYMFENEWKRWSTQYSNTIASAKKLLEQLQQTHAPDTPIFTYIASRLGTLEYRAGSYHNAAKLFITALIHNERMRRKMDVLAETQKVGLTYGTAGFIDEERGFHELAIRLGKALLPMGLQPRESPPSHALLMERSAVYHHNTTIYYYRSKRFDLAEEANQEALRLFRILPLTSQRNTQRAAVSHERALLFAQKNDYSEAIAHMEQALNLTRDAYGENHPRMAESLTCHAVLLFLVGKQELVKSYLHKALKLKMQLYQETSHPSVLATLLAMGFTAEREIQAMVDISRIFEHRPIFADAADVERDE